MSHHVDYSTGARHLASFVQSFNLIEAFASDWRWITGIGIFGSAERLSSREKQRICLAETVSVGSGPTQYEVCRTLDGRRSLRFFDGRQVWSKLSQCLEGPLEDSGREHRILVGPTMTSSFSRKETLALEGKLSGAASKDAVALRYPYSATNIWRLPMVAGCPKAS